jgi:hypothetical protein
MFSADIFFTLTADFRKESIRRRNGNSQYICTRLQKIMVEHWGDPDMWISSDILSSVLDFFIEYTNHSNHISTITNMLVDWSVKTDYSDNHKLYIAFTEFIIEKNEFNPDNLGFWIGGEWSNPFDTFDGRTIFDLESAAKNYLKEINMTPIQYMSKHPNTPIKTLLVRLIGKN